MDLDKLTNIFRNANAQRAIDKMIYIATSLGLSLTSIDFLRNMLFGYIEGYLNGATCPKCFERLGDAREVPDFTICEYCGNKVGVIKITPLRLYLTIANQEDLFRVIPDKIKIPDKLGIVKKFGSVILKFYDALTIDLIFEPLLEWMRNVRPDLYYTLAFYPKLPEPVQMLYEIDFVLKDEDVLKLGEEFGISGDPKTVRKLLKDGIIEGMELAIEKRAREGKEPVSYFAIKTFAWQIDMLKAKMREVLVRYINED